MPLYCSMTFRISLSWFLRPKVTNTSPMVVNMRSKKARRLKRS